VPQPVRELFAAAGRREPAQSNGEDGEQQDRDDENWSRHRGADAEQEDAVDQTSAEGTDQSDRDSRRHDQDPCVDDEEPGRGNPGSQEVPDALVILQRLAEVPVHHPTQPVEVALDGRPVQPVLGP
jgi:hypothetical protein